MKLLKVLLALAILMGPAVTAAPDAVEDPGYPTWSMGPTGPGQQTWGTDSWSRVVDATDSVTEASITGYTLFNGGGLAQEESGGAMAWEQAEWRGTITGASSPSWNVTVAGKVRATAWAQNYTAGSGTYSCNANAKINFQSTVSGQSYVREAKPNCTIRPPNSFLSAYGQVSGDPGSATEPNKFTQINWTCTGTECRFKLMVSTNGSVVTSRAEVTLHADAYVEEDIVATIVAMDNGTPFMTISLD
ncbi:hypothetical protein EDM80_15495 [bacterium]|nr:MAG: hypothetical protein EDM80_15495 [bacterium]RIK60503.1 MAG: hypothetical protein DCC64_14600 [Planctomycetota bacterium]